MRAQQGNGLGSLMGLGLLFLGVMIGGSGCATRYRVTLTNGNVFTASGKPKFHKETGAYTFKDTRGQQVTVPGFRVQEVAPVGMEDKVEFGPMKSPAGPRQR